MGSFMMRFLLTTSPLLLLVLLVMDTNAIHIRSVGGRIPKRLDNEMNVDYATKMTTKGALKNYVMDKTQKDGDKSSNRGLYEMQLMQWYALDTVSSAVARNFHILIATTTMVSLVLLYIFVKVSSSIIKRCRERRKDHNKEMK